MSHSSTLGRPARKTTSQHEPDTVRQQHIQYCTDGEATIVLSRSTLKSKSGFFSFDDINGMLGVPIDFNICNTGRGGNEALIVRWRVGLKERGFQRK